MSNYDETAIPPGQEPLVREVMALRDGKQTVASAMRWLDKWCPAWRSGQAHPDKQVPA